MKAQAIAICRVSTPEQRLSNSLNRQAESVYDAASRLDVEIVKVWSGDASSKVGKNVKRKDLNEAYNFCKSNRRVKYLIVDEVDRFMRSIKEMFYWQVKLEVIGVKLHFANNMELNGADAKASLLLSLDGFKAEGSNEERQHKSISGHEKAIREGRYTFPPKPGYMKSSEPGIHIPNPSTFIPLQKAFRDIAHGLRAPQESLKELNESTFIDKHSPLRMDKFSSFAIDPYYCGILKINRQVKSENANGLHEKMLTIQEHESLVNVFTGRLKPRGPKKQYNPEFPMNKILICGDCEGEVKFTGSTKNNGYSRKTTRYYNKYHCRGCGKSYHRDEVHDKINERLNSLQFNDNAYNAFRAALTEVWERKQQSNISTIKSQLKRLNELKETKSKLVLALATSDLRYRSDIEDELDTIKAKINDLESNIKELSNIHNDLIEFIEFGITYTNRLSTDWWKLSHEERVRCQLLLFPGGISFNSEKKVGTNQLSPIYSLKPNKKDLSNNEKSLLVELRGNAPRSSSLRHYNSTSLFCLMVLGSNWLNKQNSHYSNLGVLKP